MRAIIVDKPGGIEQLKAGECPVPIPGDGELLVKVKATAVNRADIFKRMGKYPGDTGTKKILGLEMAGVVEQAGSDCNGWKIGDRIFGLLPAGGYAEYAVIPGEMAMRIPDNLSFEQAASIPEVFLTAYQTLFWQGELKEGESVLIHAGASGVGTAAIQLAKHIGARVIVTAGSDEKLAVCRSLGADTAINYKRSSFDQEVRKVTGEQGVHVILDFVGASYWEQNLSSLAVDGRLVLISSLGGSRVDNVNLAAIYAKRITIIGTLLSPRSLAYKIQLTREFVRDVLPLFEEGKVKPVIDRIYPLEEVGEAHRRMEENKNIGKLVLTL
jgi:putative PIG3 family NAD(P)H quinone oxidoreductase